MAVRPFAFGARLRDKGRTVSVRINDRDARRYVVEDSGKGRQTQRRDHTSLGGALKDLAKTWRGRLQ